MGVWEAEWVRKDAKGFEGRVGNWLAQDREWGEQGEEMADTLLSLARRQGESELRGTEGDLGQPCRMKADGPAAEAGGGACLRPSQRFLEAGAGRNFPEVLLPLQASQGCGRSLGRFGVWPEPENQSQVANAAISLLGSPEFQHRSLAP